MRLLDRYLLRELLVPLAYCLIGFLLFWISFDLLSQLSDFQDKEMGPVEIARYYVFKTPELVMVAVPMALLLALLYALTNHARHQELTAMRAAGVSLVRLCVPYFAVGIAFSLGSFAFNELWVPPCAEAAEAMLAGKERGRQSGTGDPWYPNLKFRNGRNGRFWIIGAYNIESGEMRSPDVSWEMSDHTRRSLTATNAVRSNGCWIFYDVQELIYQPATNFEDSVSSIRTNVLAIPEFSETPEQIKSEIKVGHFLLSSIKPLKEAQLSVAEIQDYFRLHPHLSALDAARLHTQLHKRLAWPWTCLVVVLIAIPFGAPSGRRNVFVGVASSIFICFVFFILMELCLTLGARDSVPPWLAAWLPNGLFALSGAALISRVQ